MATEREHARTSSTTSSTHDRDDLAPGRASPSSKLDAPAAPIISALVQRKAIRDDNGVADDADHAIASAAGSSGMALPTTIQRKFESSLGTDLSDVRVHTGSESATAASAVGAKAYTVGQDIHFGAGHYDPSNTAGEHLLAHEVAHTVQQRGGSPTRQNKLEVSTPFDAAEHEADRAADAMVSGAQVVVGGGSGVARKIYREPNEQGANAHANGGHASGAFGGASVSWTTPKKKLAETSISFAKLEASATGKLSGSVKPAGEKEGGHEGSHTKGSVGAGFGDSKAKVKAEVETEYETGITGLSARTIAGAKYDGKSFTLGEALSLETKWGPVALESKPIAFELAKWEPGKDPEFLTLSMSVEGSVPLHTFTAQSGELITVGGAVEVEIEAHPDYAKIARWFAENVVKAIGAEGLVAAGFVVAGVATIAASLFQIISGDDISARVNNVVPGVRGYCNGYASAFYGKPQPNTVGAEKGYVDGLAYLKTIQTRIGLPSEAAFSSLLVKLMPDYFALYKQAAEIAWPVARRQMLDQYKRDHSVDTWLSDRGLPSNHQKLDELISEFDTEFSR